MYIIGRFDKGLLPNALNVAMLCPQKLTHSPMSSVHPCSASAPARLDFHVVYRQIFFFFGSAP
jgi:hypothetical protein